MKVVWSNLAKITYFEILENIQDRWSLKEVSRFFAITEKVLNDLSSGKVQWPLIDEDRGIRKSILHSNVSLFYIENQRDKHIYLGTFFNNRVNPDKLKRLLRRG